MEPSCQKNSSRFWNLIWDIWCVVSIVGIWPRFIEPRLLSTTKLTIQLPDLAQVFNNFKILFFSDIHISSITSKKFLAKVSKRIAQEKPNIILIGGDFLTHSSMDGKELLHKFLSSLQSSHENFHGVFACLGNHDYQEYVTLGKKGAFVIQNNTQSSIIAGFKRLFRSKKEPLSQEASRHKPLLPIPELVLLLKNAGVTLLENERVVLTYQGRKLQLAGIGDIMAGQARPDIAFANWDPTTPGIVINHNPDAWPLLKPYPGNIYLFGHTHGGQVNLPWMWKKLTPLVNIKFKRGLFQEGSSNLIEEKKTLYVSRGIGSTFPFRWFSIPEIVSITLSSSPLSRQKIRDALPSLQMTYTQSPPAYIRSQKSALSNPSHEIGSR